MPGEICGQDKKQTKEKGKLTMELFSMQCFLSAAEHLNLSKAAVQMNITQPAMSVQIKKLEKEIGVSLFERSSHKMRLTPAGQVVRKSFTSIIGSYNVMLWQARSLEEKVQCLRVGYHGPSDWAGILGLLKGFMQENPDVRVTIQSMEFGELARKLEEGGLDLAFLETSDVEGRELLQWIPVFDDYGCFAVSRDHPLSGRRKVWPEEIQDQTVYFNLRNSASMQSIFHRLLESGIAPEKLVCVEGTETAIALAVAYGGMAAVPMTFKTDQNPQIAYVDNASPVVHLNFCLAWRRNNETEPLRRFVRSCRDYRWPHYDMARESEG